MGRRRYMWSSSRCEKQGARSCGEVNNEEDMEVNKLVAGK